MYHRYVPGVISLQMTPDGIPQVVILPLPLRTGTAVHVLFCSSTHFLPSRGFSYSSLFCDHGARFKENELT